MSSEKAILHYFNGRGLAEIVRLTMVASGIEWEQRSITDKSQFQKLKDENKLLFNELPLVEYKNQLLVQSNVIAKYFARKGGLLGKDKTERLNIEILYDGSRDFLSYFLGYGFTGWNEVIDAAKERALPKYLPIYNNVLRDNGSCGYLVGENLSLADLSLLEVVLTIEDLIEEDVFKNYPHLKKFRDTIVNIPSIASYLTGPRRFKKNDEEYVDQVKKTLW